MLNGSDLTLSCTFHELQDGQTAEDLHWVTCADITVCHPIPTSHHVELMDNRTSVVHLQDLRMPEEGETTTETYRCCLNCNEFEGFETSTLVYVGSKLGIV